MTEDLGEIVDGTAITTTHTDAAASIVLGCERSVAQHGAGFGRVDGLMVVAIAFGALFCDTARRLGMEPSTALMLYGDTLFPTKGSTRN